jgi:hypothetical protein
MPPPRIPDRIVFEKLVQVLCSALAYERIADGSCSATTLKCRRDEWIAAGVIDSLREMALEAYDRMVGLEPSGRWTAASRKPPAAGRGRARVS